MAGSLANTIIWFFKQKWLVWLSLIFAYSSVSLFNGYPILYSDTATYLSSGFELEAPADRPIVYGILLRLFSLNGLSLLFVPVFQTALFLFSLHNLLALFFDKEKVLKQVFLFAFLILIFTGFGWSINLLLPDIFTAIGFISLFCLLMSKKKSGEQLLLFILFFISTSSHISNVPIFFMLALLAFFTKSWFFPNTDSKRFKYKLLIILGILGVSYLIMGSAISKSKHVFMMGSMAQKGILQEVLNDSCYTSNFKLCPYKDSIPHSFDYFVWDKKSPLYIMGGWKATKEEYRKIIGISFSEPKYLVMHVNRSSVNFLKQLITFGIAEGTGKFGNETPLINRIQRYTVLDASLCLNTHQYRSDFTNMPKINSFYKIVMFVASCILILLLIFKYKKLNVELKSLIVFTLLLILSNSALVAFTGEVSNRFGCKIVWLVLLLDFVIMARGIHPKRSDFQS